jgi:hypothetical protein
MPIHMSKDERMIGSVQRVKGKGKGKGEERQGKARQDKTTKSPIVNVIKPKPNLKAVPKFFNYDLNAWYNYILELRRFRVGFRALAILPKTFRPRLWGLFKMTCQT